jgi:flagellar hook protein FlgE
MLKSLFSGVSGLQAHQLAMDIESNNIANVNTTGFKYSRANFSDHLAQKKTVATSPEGELGGRNALQVGLGSRISSATRIFVQGSSQDSEKNTDVAIQGDGFFMVSPDGGTTNKYTRAGDFKFDSSGNFVDNNGYIVQGWLRDTDINKVDATAPIQNIGIKPGLTMPAKATEELNIKANLNSGSTVKSYLPAYTIASTPPPVGAVGGAPAVISPAPSAKDRNDYDVNSGDFGVMFNESGESFALQNRQGIWASFRPSEQILGIPDDGTDDMTVDFTVDRELGVAGDVVEIRVTNTGTSKEKADALAAAINKKTDIHGVVASVDDNGQITLVNDNGDDTRSHNNITTNVSTGLSEGTAITAYKYQYNPDASVKSAGGDKTFTTMADLREAMELEARHVGDADTPTNTDAGTATLTDAASPGVEVTFTLAGVTIKVDEPDNTSADDMAQFYVDAINNANIDGITALVDPANTDHILVRNATPDDAILNIAAVTGHNGFAAGDTTIDKAVGDGTADENNISIEVNKKGQFELKNPGGSDDGDYNINLKITSYTDKRQDTKILKNIRFSDSMESLGTSLEVGTTAKSLSRKFNAATHSASIDIYDSVGSKHTVRLEFRKVSVSVATGAEWSVKASVPTPGVIDTVAPTNEKNGIVRFNNEGLYASSTLQTLTFTGNNGSARNQQINLNFGTAGLYDGLRSFDAKSSTTDIYQDGYTGGDLEGILIDQSGTLVGTFSNGRSFGLAQIAMAKFTNNGGLATEGGNIFVETANSGGPVIGTASTSGRGFVQSSALEGSNVDLSRSLTQLIIIQRGFQANGKTITTSDQMLQTLIGLKN